VFEHLAVKLQLDRTIDISQNGQNYSVFCAKMFGGGLARTSRTKS